MSYSDKIKIKNLRNRNISNPIYSKIVKNGLVLYLDGKDFKNNPPTSIWRDRSQGSKYIYNNLVSNGDFSNGVTGWASSNASLSTSNNTLTATGTGTSQYVAPYQTTPTACVTGKKIYIRTNVTVISGIATSIYLQVTGTTTGGMAGPSISNPVIGTTYKMSNIFTLDGVLTGNINVYPVVGNFGNTLGANGSKVQAQQVMMVDLTALFGAGAEPDINWCNANLGFVPNNALSSITTDYNGKVSGSVVENPNITKYYNSSSLQNPSAFTLEVSQNGYNYIKTLDTQSLPIVTNVNGTMAQQLFQFNLIADIEKAFNKPIPNDGSIASKINWIQNNCTISPNWVGYGSGPLGNKAYLKIALFSNGSFTTYSTGTNNTSNSPTALGWSNLTLNGTNYLDNNGFINILASADASNGTIASTIYTDMINLQINFVSGATLDFGTAYKGNNATASNFNYVSNLPSSITTDYANKVSGSIVANPNISKHNMNEPQTSLIAPSSFVTEVGGSYSLFSALDGSTLAITTNKPNAISQQSFQFDLIKNIEKAYGKPIPTSDGTVASKVAWIKANISSLASSWYGYGNGPLGYKATFARYEAGAYYTNTSGSTNTSSSPSLCTEGVSNSNMIQSDGTACYLAYADAARTTDSTYLCLTNHGLGLIGDVIENTTRGIATSTNGGTTNGISIASAITGQVAGDTINKYRVKPGTIAAGAGTTTTNLVIPGHGLATGDYIKNSSKSWILSKVTVVDANTVTLSTAITGQAQGDIIYLYPLLGTQIAEGLTNATFLGLNSHGLSQWDIIENTNKSKWSQALSIINSNSITTSSITGQVAGDSINKYHLQAPTYTASTGTNDTTLVLPNHGLSTGDYISNTTRTNAIRKVTVVDANTLTVSTAITGQVSGDSIKKFIYYGNQQANDIVISSTIYTDYVNLQINFVDTSSGSDTLNSVVFDAIDDIVNCGNSSGFNFNYGTFECFITPLAIPPAYARIFSKELTLGSDSFNVVLSADMKVYCYIGGAQIISTLQAMTLNTPVHITVKNDGVNAKIYVNGVLNNSVVYAGSIPTTTNNLLIGGANGQRYTKMAMKLARIYNRALTDQEILKNYYASR